MKTNECVLIKGVERFSTYTGYAHTFCWVSDYVDHTPIDKTGRRQTDIVAIDALFYFNVRQQFDIDKINRELVKSFVGFSTSMGPHVCSTVATGNWGCGVFNGDRQLKCKHTFFCSKIKFLFVDCYFLICCF
jgi:poly(ADP-ribose) glycohydrolase